MRILVFAYACEPGSGSEPGAGWMWSRLLARFGETWVVTRANNRDAIEAALEGTLERDRLRFVWVDLPQWSRRWKRGQRGIRLYYMLWQLAAYRTARRLHDRMPFDMVWHVTLSTGWLGSLGALLGPPFVYGPVGGGASPSWRILPALGARGLAYEGTREVAQGAGRYLNPIARMAWGRSRLILTENEETRRWLPRRHRGRAVVLPHVIIEDRSQAVGGSDGTSKEPGAERTALFAGRLLGWKGVALALRAIALLPEWRLIVAGSGPDERRLRKLAERLGIDGRVEFRGRVPRGVLLDMMRREASVFLFPSTHDDAPWVVVEASLAGLPVVCLDVGGPPILGGRAVPVSTPGRTARALADKVLEVAGTPPAEAEPFFIEAREAIVGRVLAGRGLIPSPTALRDEAAR